LTTSTVTSDPSRTRSVGPGIDRVGEHADARITESLYDRSDPELDRVTVGNVDHLRPDRLGEAGRFGREALLDVRAVFVRVLQRAPSTAPARDARLR
jgi:hypothetical protein